MVEKEILTTRPGCIPTLCDPLAPDPILDLYRKDVDVTLLRENLKLTVPQRAAKFTRFLRSLDRVRGIARRSY